MTTSPCKGCGRPIVWAVDEAGKSIPCDPRAVIYDVTAVEDGPNTAKRARGVDNALGQTVAPMVSHFATCSQANRFSKQPAVGSKA